MIIFLLLAPICNHDQKLLYVFSDAMWEPLKDSGGRRAYALDEESGELFYIANATVAFVCFGPADNTWHESSKKIGFV